MLDKIKQGAAAARAKIKAACFGSITMAWSYILSLGGTLLQNVDGIAAVLGDPTLTEQIKTVFRDPKLIGQWLLAVGIVTTVARLKSILWPKEG